MNRNIVLMIHIPESAPDCQLEMLKQMKHLFDVCSSHLEKQFESWELNFDDEAYTGVSYSYDTQRGEWHRIGCDMLGRKPCAQASVVSSYYCSDLSHLQMIGMNATLLPHTKYIRFPQDYGERSLRMDIPAELWECIDSQALIIAIKEACVALGATYACIDVEAPVGGMHEGWFRRLSDSSQSIDIESRLPGIYWWQLVSPMQVEKTGKLFEIANYPLGIKMEIIDNEGYNMLMIQLSNNPMTTYRKQRLEMRNYFKDSLYNISADTLNLSSITGWLKWEDLNAIEKEDILQRMKRIPLTDEEIECITLRLQTEK